MLVGAEDSGELWPEVRWGWLGVGGEERKLGPWWLVVLEDKIQLKVVKILFALFNKS